MKKIYIHKIIIVLFFIPSTAIGQITYTGRVIDTRTKVAFPGAEVSVLGSDFRVITDNSGQFSLVTGIDENEPDEDFELVAASNSILWYSEKMMDIRITPMFLEWKGKQL